MRILTFLTICMACACGCVSTPLSHFKSADRRIQLEISGTALFSKVNYEIKLHQYDETCGLYGSLWFCDEYGKVIYERTFTNVVNKLFFQKALDETLRISKGFIFNCQDDEDQFRGFGTTISLYDGGGVQSLFLYDFSNNIGNQKLFDNLLRLVNTALPSGGLLPIQGRWGPDVLNLFPPDVDSGHDIEHP